MPERKPKYVQVENKAALIELLDEGQDFVKIYIANNAFRDPRTKHIIQLASERQIPIEKITRKRISSLAKTKGCESVIGLKPISNQFTLEDVLENAYESKKNLFFLILNDIQYSQNLGALMRTAYASGVTAVILPKNKGRYLSEDVTRISTGASERIPIVQMNIFDAIKRLKDNAVKIVGVSMEGQEYYHKDISGNVALVLGNEHAGISPRVIEKCDDLVSIPMQEGLDSLNVSAAGAVLMFEKKRQDSSKK